MKAPSLQAPTKLSDKNKKAKAAKVLLIEPDRILGRTTAIGLESKNHKVTWCSSAQAALDTLEKRMPDVIVLEIQLGSHNGIEFLHELQSYPEWQQIPVIIYTINVNVLDDRFGEAFVQLGVQAVLYKPRTSTAQFLRSIAQIAPVT